MRLRDKIERTPHAAIDAQNKYVVGFGLTHTGPAGRILLVRKLRPAWQNGYLNGIGGKIEPGETVRDAMLREAQEEARLGHLDWRLRGTMTGINNDGASFFCGVFAVVDTKVMDYQQVEDEPLELHNVDCNWSYVDCIDNLRFMIPFLTSKDPSFFRLLY